MIDDLNSNLILDYDNGLNKTYTTPKRGIIRLVATSATSGNFQYGVQHSGVAHSQLSYGNSAGFSQNYDFCVNANEIIKVIVYTNIGSVGGMFIPYK